MEKGIHVGGTTYPVVKMDWVDGQTMGGYIEDNFRNPNLIRGLRENLRRLYATLQQSGAAHGDIQVGNIMVSDGGLKLIDYDGMFVPGMQEHQGNETGHLNFQHPARTDTDFDATIDRFAFILLELSLAAVECKSDLFKVYSTGENVLFSKPDFESPQYSGLFRELSAIAQIKELAKLFAKICVAPMGNIPQLQDFISLKPIESLEQTPVAGIAAPQIKPERPSYQGPYSVYDADDFDALELAAGTMAEVVGYVTEVKSARTKHGKPYVFVNFGFWKDDIFKLNIWSEGLANFRVDLESTFEDQWVSVTGLVDEPYYSSKFGYTHASITVHQPSQIHVISEKEVRYRLGQVSTGGLNYEDSNRQPPKKGRPGRSSSRSASPSNKELIHLMNNKGAAHKDPPYSAGGRNYSSYHPDPKRTAGYYVKRIFFWVVVVIGALIWLMLRR